MQALSRHALCAGAIALALGPALPAAGADLHDTVKARGSVRIAMEGSYPA